MVEGWTRICPDCGNSDGAKVERAAFHPTFQCECGYIWDGSGCVVHRTVERGWGRDR